MKKIINNIWSVLTKKERGRFRLLSILDILITIADIGCLVALVWIVQFYVQPEKTPVLPFLKGWMRTQNFIFIISVFFLFFAIKNAAGYFLTKTQYSFISEIAVRISENSLAHYQQAGFTEFIGIDSSVHLRKIGYQPFEFCQYVLSGMQLMITQGFLILLSAISIIFFNAHLFLLLLCILLPPVIVVFYIIKRRLSLIKRFLHLSNEKSHQYLMDALKGFVEGNIYNRNNFFLKRFVAARRRFSHYLFDTLSIQTLPGRVIELFAILGLFLLIAIARWTGSSNNLLTIGAFMAAAYKIIPGLVKMINTGGQIKAFESSITDVMNANIEERKTTVDAPPLSSVQFKNICFKYDDRTILKDISFKISRGDFVGISGKSGRGKTTLLNLLLGFLKSDEGHILMNDKCPGEKGLNLFWPSIAYVRQQPFLIHDSVLKNICLCEEAVDPQKLNVALNVSGWSGLATRFAEGIDTVITENGNNISGGQRQRIAIARAVYKDADLILLDEPFNELDEASEITLLHHFSAMAKKGKMIVLITHDKRSLSYCNKIIELDEY